MIEASDHVIDFGPGAGVRGGQVVAAASPGKLRKSRESLTGRYLANRESVAVPTNRRAVEWPGGDAGEGEAPAEPGSQGAKGGRDSRASGRKGRAISLAAWTAA